MTVREDRFGNVVQASRPSTNQVVVIGPGSIQCVPFTVNQDRPQRDTEGNPQPSSQLNHTRHIRLIATVPCWVSFGSPPQAAVRQGASSMFMPAGLAEYFWVAVAEAVSVTQDATGGFLYITELTN